MKYTKNIIAFLTLLSLSFLTISHANAEVTNIASKQVFPNSINTSSIGVGLEKIYLYDKNKDSVFGFKDTDTTTWVSYKYEWSNVTNISLTGEFHKDSSVKIEMFRNGRLVDEKIEKLATNFNKNIVVDGDITTDEVRLTVFIQKRSNLSDQNYNKQVALLGSSTNIAEFQIYGEEKVLDFKKDKIDKIVNNFFSRLSKKSKEGQITVLNKFVGILSNMSNKNKNYILIEYLLLRMSDRMYEVQKAIDYEKILKLMDK